MGGNENTKDSDIDGRDEQGRSPLQLSNCTLRLGDDLMIGFSWVSCSSGNPRSRASRIEPQDSDLLAMRLMIICINSWIWKTHANRMKKRTGTLERSAVTTPAWNSTRPDSHWCQNTFEEKEAQDEYHDVGENFTPDHGNIRASARILASLRLFDGLPDRQKAEAEGESYSNRTDSLVLAIVEIAGAGHMVCLGRMTHVNRASEKWSSHRRMQFVHVLNLTLEDFASLLTSAVRKLKVGYSSWPTRRWQRADRSERTWPTMLITKWAPQWPLISC